jgi:hypothetical protein
MEIRTVIRGLVSNLNTFQESDHNFPPKNPIKQLSAFSQVRMCSLFVHFIDRNTFKAEWREEIRPALLRMVGLLTNSDCRVRECALKVLSPLAGIGTLSAYSSYQ